VDPNVSGAHEIEELPTPDAEAWWAEPGWAGWTPDAELGSAFAWSLAGHSLGGWSRDYDGSAPLDLPWPAVTGAKRPIVWSDSLAAGWGEHAGWLGPDAGLATIESVHQPTRNLRARSIFRFESGDLGVARYSLAFERGDSARWVRYETNSGNHTSFGSVGRGGDHIWNAAVHWSHGNHQLNATLGQRGVAQELAHADVSDHASGQSGSVGWSWAHSGRSAGLTFARGLDHRESIIDVGGIQESFSRREAQESRIEGEAHVPLGSGLAGARVLWSESRVTRLYDGAFDAHEHLGWIAASYARPAGDGALQFEVGGGRSGALDKNLIAPSAAYAFGTASPNGGTAASGRVVIERMVKPVWSDLAFGQSSFLQSTTAIGLEARSHAGAFTASGDVLTGVTRDRAIVFPYPIEDIWLQAGATAESQRYDFALVTASLRAQRGAWAIGASGFALGRDQDASEPRVEPGSGVRAFLETGFRAFQNDLGVRVHVESDEVGARESKNGADEYTLKGYWTESFWAVLSLADVTVTLRTRNIENQVRQQTWIDPGTGSPAVSPGRQFRLTFSWRMFN
jgi:hypothetical protein